MTYPRLYRQVKSYTHICTCGWNFVSTPIHIGHPCVGSPFLMSNDNGVVVANVKLRVPCHGFGSHELWIRAYWQQRFRHNAKAERSHATRQLQLPPKSCAWACQSDNKNLPSSHTHTTTSFSVFTLHHGSCEQNKQTKADQVNIPARDATAAPCLLFSSQTRNTPWFQAARVLVSPCFCFFSLPPAKYTYKFQQSSWETLQIHSVCHPWPHLITPCRMQQGITHVCAGLDNLACY